VTGEESNEPSSWVLSYCDAPADVRGWVFLDGEAGIIEYAQGVF
jgi:hypothetical protein